MAAPTKCTLFGWQCLRLPNDGTDSASIGLASPTAGPSVAPRYHTSKLMPRGPLTAEACRQAVESLHRASTLAQAMLYGTQSTVLREQVAALRSASSDAKFEQLLGEALQEHSDTLSLLGPELRLFLRDLARLDEKTTAALTTAGGHASAVDAPGAAAAGEHDVYALADAGDRVMTLEPGALMTDDDEALEKRHPTSNEHVATTGVQSVASGGSRQNSGGAMAPIAEGENGQAATTTVIGNSRKPSLMSKDGRPLHTSERSLISQADAVAHALQKADQRRRASQVSEEQLRQLGAEEERRVAAERAEAKRRVSMAVGVPVAAPGSGRRASSRRTSRASVVRLADDGASAFLSS